MKIKKSIFILMVIVLITILGTVLYKGEKYNLIIIASFALSCLPFYFKYENSKPKIREVVVLATMIALTVVSRTPQEPVQVLLRIVFSCGTPPFIVVLTV